MRLIVVALVGFGFGFGTNQIPAPDHFGPMWIAQLAAPYAVLPFLVGAWALRTPRGAMTAGLVVEFAAFFGYYLELVVDTGGGWLNLLTFRNPWLVFEVFAGLVFGGLGHVWWRRRRVFPGLVCAAVVVLEPVVLLFRWNAWLFRRLPVLNLYPSEYPRSAWNLSIWAVEVAAGVILGLLVLLHGRRAWSPSAPAERPAALGRRP